MSFSETYRANGGRIFIHPLFINHATSTHMVNAEKFLERGPSPSMVKFPIYSDMPDAGSPVADLAKQRYVRDGQSQPELAAEHQAESAVRIGATP